MDDATIESLAALDRRFYDDNAASFMAKRQHPWRGWRRVLPLCGPGARVLDVGCGHGRFLRYLDAERPDPERTYLGLDHSEGLLRAARQAHGHQRFERVELTQSPRVTHGVFDLVVAFGVLHHIPSERLRCELLCYLAEHVAPGGHLVFTLWTVDPDGTKQRPAPEGLELGPKDLILGWGPNPEARRYCHDVDEQERHALVEATGLSLQDEFRDDGRANRNRYLVLRNGL